MLASESGQKSTKVEKKYKQVSEIKYILYPNELISVSNQTFPLDSITTYQLSNQTIRRKWPMKMM